MNTEQRFKVGDVVRVVADCRWRNKLTTIVAVETVLDSTTKADENYPTPGETCYRLDLHWHPGDPGVVALADHIQHASDGERRVAH